MKTPIISQEDRMYKAYVHSKLAQLKFLRDLDRSAGIPAAYIEQFAIKISIFLNRKKIAILRSSHDQSNSTDICRKKDCSEPVHEFGLCFKHHCISEENIQC